MNTLMLFRSIVVAVALGFVAGCAATPNYSAIVANPDRPANERELDAARKPSEVLAFYGVRSGDRVADLWAGRGYYTAILSEVVGPTGVVYTQNPNSRDEINQRWKSAKFANVKITDGAFDKLPLPQDGSLDFVCCSKVNLSGSNSNVIMSGWKDDNPDDERRETTRRNSTSVSK